MDHEKRLNVAVGCIGVATAFVLIAVWTGELIGWCILAGFLCMFAGQLVIWPLRTTQGESSPMTEALSSVSEGWKIGHGSNLAHYVVPPKKFRIQIKAVCGRTSMFWHAAEADTERCEKCVRGSRT